MHHSSNASLNTIADLLGVPVDAFSALPAVRVLHASRNGDQWLLLNGRNGVPTVRHIGNAASGGHATEYDVSAFLARDAGSPQHAALVALIDDALSAYLAR
jgi:hypothetical protein